MTSNRITNIIDKFKGRKILVFGDIILDRYIFGSVNRISPEAPVPVLKVEREEYRPGGAANVAVNIDSLGAEAVLLGVTGSDEASAIFSGLKSDGLRIIRSGKVATLVKTRVISQKQQIVRIDREQEIEIDSDMLSEIAQILKEEEFFGIIVSDYNKGTVTEEIMDLLKECGRERGIPVIVDPKPENMNIYRGVTGITPNLKETQDILRKTVKGDKEAVEAARLIRRRFDLDFAMITRGAEGITGLYRGRKAFNMPAYSHEVFDVTGAGDTVAALLTLVLSVSGTLKEAAVLANAAASIVVERVGASSATAGELKERLVLLKKRKTV